MRHPQSNRNNDSTKRAGRRPSPALLLGLTALVLALAGTALAGPTAVNKLSKAKVRAIANKQIAKKAPSLSVRTAASAGNAANAENAANADSLGGVPASGYQPRLLSAVVRANGTLARGTGAVSAQRESAGRYYVRFNRSVADCTLVASTTSATPVGLPQDVLGYASVGPRWNIPTDVVVRVGTDSSPDADDDFAVVAVC